MTAPACSNEAFVEIWKRLGSPALVARELGVSERAVYERRNRIERATGISLETDNSLNPAYQTIKGEHHDAIAHITIENGIVVCFSDAHYWPDIKTTAHRALVKFLAEMGAAVRAVVCNGDAFDGASISRWPRIGWDNKPTVKQELEAVQDRLGEIEDVVSGATPLVWPLGNHDARFETYLAANAPQYEGIEGFALKDRFSRWKPCWRFDVNAGTRDHTVIKHRWKGGIHATRNNTMGAGVHFVTGHLHAPKVAPNTNIAGTFYGVDCGTLADPDGPQFVDYTEAGVKDWRSGFVVLTYWKGRLLQPEHALVIDESAGLIQFRGKVWSV